MQHALTRMLLFLSLPISLALALSLQSILKKKNRSALSLFSSSSTVVVRCTLFQSVLCMRYFSDIIIIHLPASLSILIIIKVIPSYFCYSLSTDTRTFPSLSPSFSLVLSLCVCFYLFYTVSLSPQFFFFAFSGAERVHRCIFAVSWFSVCT